MTERVVAHIQIDNCGGNESMRNRKARLAMSHGRTGAVVGVVLSCALALSACGGGSTDKDKVTAVVKAIAATPSNYCDPKYVDANFIKQYETTGCDFKTQPPVKNLKINAITINRDMAVVSESAPLGAGSKPGTVTLKKQGGVWKVDYAIQLD